ncbi:MAG: hypothetical protein D6703_03480 [Zetaproteobacteria bacterium]|nr:MAG: hypothetical protein D6703_03480 [Zetaproteobacteria bacterium]
MIRILIVVVLIVLGAWVGKNIHDGKPWYSNPFASNKETHAIVEDVSKTATEAVGTGLEAVGEGGKKVAETIDEASTTAIEKGKKLKVGQ